MEHGNIISPDTFDQRVEQLADRIDQWVEDEIIPFADADDLGMPTGTEGNIFSDSPLISSKRVLDASDFTEEIMGFRIPPIIIQKGGYDTKEELKAHLLPQLRRVTTGEIKIKNYQDKKMKVVSL